MFFLCMLLALLARRSIYALAFLNCSLFLLLTVDDSEIKDNQLTLLSVMTSYIFRSGLASVSQSLRGNDR